MVRRGPSVSMGQWALLLLPILFLYEGLLGSGVPRSTTLSCTMLIVCATAVPTMPEGA
ncbi:hypothetical protein Naga_100768g3 [Nannochloropsis gaditana]|uniref:Uncharacterized protein n=1 Tax=Nannochloropsis gaditana TaxID=72520 RepID=W7TFA2_9STRA|nr:hypothetical protein Naga_100768g3 [Nannochloropsis gaditana]